MSRKHEEAAHYGYALTFRKYVNDVTLEAASSGISVSAVSRNVVIMSRKQNNSQSVNKE